jgi:hypothetical protein
MYYVIRVEFPDEDKYVYVTNDDGTMAKYYNREVAEKVASTYADSNSTIEERHDNEGIPWSI